MLKHVESQEACPQGRVEAALDLSQNIHPCAGGFRACFPAHVEAALDLSQNIHLPWGDMIRHWNPNAWQKSMSLPVAGGFRGGVTFK